MTTEVLLPCFLSTSNANRNHVAIQKRNAALSKTC